MKKLLYVSTLAFALTACEKEEIPLVLDGTYSGTFRTLENKKEKISDFEVILDNRRFITNKGGAGLGPFEVGRSGMVKFYDELFYTANFDWNTILTGDYSYEVKGDSLILIKTFLETAYKPNPSNYYQYRLKKIK
ncbi:hypothetical protein WG904_07115 [Pedobacter sp. Du54]|uniref:hypothetical protein n=1 Tax=Pedobacter anseongensis TaxID=3133439 RepID=UPI0030A8A057